MEDFVKKQPLTLFNSTTFGELSGLGHASICPDQRTYDTNNARIQRQIVCV